MPKTILIHEWVTGGGLAGKPLPPSLAAEGRAMRQALAYDFHQAGNVDVVMTLDSRFEATEPYPFRSEIVHVGEEDETLVRLANQVDFTLVVAPETDGVLGRLVGRLRNSHARSLNANAEAISLAGDKIRTAWHLESHGVRNAGILDLLWSSHTRFPVVLKPAYGAGAVATFLLNEPNDVAFLPELPSVMILQEYVPGTPMSATFLVVGDHVQLLAIGRQNVAVEDRAFRYRGGTLPLDSRLAGGAPEAAVRSIPGLQGLVGVDFVLNDRTGEATVLEINPRPTTSFVGLTKLYGPGRVATAWLEAVESGTPVALEYGPVSPFSFSSEGQIVPSEKFPRIDIPGAWLALDIGGANLKAAHTNSTCRSASFALWRNPAGLSAELKRLASTFPRFSRVALTTTAELCDCFETKREGVLAVLGAAASAFPGVPLEVWSVDGRLASPEEIRERPHQAAAANWMALGVEAGRLAGPGPGILIDVGSTTTDIIPIEDGVPAPRGRTDTERLQSGELVYLGVRRTPLSAVAGLVELSGRTTPLMAEFFATSLDIFLLLSRIPEDPEDHDTADGRPATRVFARDRLARMVGGDRESVSMDEALDMASRLRERVMTRLAASAERVIKRMTSPPSVAVVSGSGEFLARALAARVLPPGGRVIRLSEMWGEDASRAACAWALLRIATDSNNP